MELLRIGIIPLRKGIMRRIDRLIAIVKVMKTNPKTNRIHFGANGEVTIPLWLRKEFNIEEGRRALVYREGDAIVLKPITPRHIRNLRGSLKGSGVLKALMDGRKRERELK
jgi:bifunctional DNA-binding transcriptional regulator/antitoxin component of YhaV-PrlF toxin-antitoxin module